jgi:TM2 domain-containing membrane protein YozV
MSYCYLLLVIMVTSAYATLDSCSTPNATTGPICSGHGVCYNDSSANETRCYCDTGYMGVDCSYHQKSQGVAFGLTWLYWIGLAGVERLYLGYTAIGVIFLLMGLSGVAFIVSSFVGGLWKYISRSGDGGVLIAVGFAVIGVADVITVLALFVWELVIISQNDLNDAHGHPLAPSW